MRMSFKYRFEAAHRFVNSDKECSTPHGHTWYATLNLMSSTEDLGEGNMVEDFGLLKKGWKSFVTQTADHSFFYNSEDPILPTLMKYIPNFRGLPFPGDPTTEVIAGLFFLKASVLCESFPVRPFSVVIEETPTNTIEFFSTEVEDFIAKLNLSLKSSNWWASSAPESRGIFGQPKAKSVDADWSS